ncbi:MAG: HXXEE domain-containing protein [Terracidiphilus sp.]|jgi:hypothetical protein
MQGSEGSFQWLLWAPLGAAAAHIFEEFVCPGGFKSWCQRYRGVNSAKITPRFLIIINAVLLAACINAATADDPIGFAYWIGISAVLASNGVWHLWAAVRSRSYSPGMVTGLIVYLPLAIFGFVHFMSSSLVSRGNAVAALLIGGSYPLWSALFHAKKRSAAEPLELSRD